MILYPAPVGNNTPPQRNLVSIIQAMINTALKALTTGVSSVFGRTGAVVAVAGDYTASQVTNVPAGTIAATDVQAAINELDTEKQASDPELTSLAGLGIVQGDTIYASAANTYSKLAKDANATRYYSNTGVSNNPAWAQVNLTNGVTGILPNANGGTGTTTAVTDYSATSTVVGWSVFTRKQIWYIDCGTYFIVHYDIIGTSNSTSTTITLPFAQNASVSFSETIIVAMNNGTQLTTSSAQSAGSSSTLTFYRDQAGTNWTNSGTKYVNGTSIIFK